MFRNPDVENKDILPTSTINKQIINNQVLLMKCKMHYIIPITTELLAVWCLGALIWVNIMSRRKDISQSGQGYKATSKQFEILRWKRLFTLRSSCQFSPEASIWNSIQVRLLNAQRSWGVGVTLCNLQASVNTLNVYVPDNAIGKRLNNYGFMNGWLE